MIEQYGPRILARSRVIFKNRNRQIHAKTDRMFGFLLLFEWLLSVIFALVLSPLSWSGEISETHIHVYAAIFLGGALATGPIFFIFLRPGALINRMMVSISQLFFSILLIHLTGGRIETHFHIFGSLAFLAFYRDWRPVALATLITSLDHLLRGAYFPFSIYGVLSASPWRAIEHAAWVFFEDIILLASISLSLRGLREASENQAKLELTLSLVERKVEERTRQLQVAQEEKEAQQLILTQSSKLSSLGEMAGGVAHEINNPLSIIRTKASQIRRLLESGRAEKNQTISFLKTIEETTVRISKIVDGLRTFARDGRMDSFSSIQLSKIFTDITGLCQERMNSKDISFETILSEDFPIECKVTQVEQILVNLISNSIDAVSNLPSKWITVEGKRENDFAKIVVTDSGTGIEDSIAEKIMQPFFTTKTVGHGTGLGLSISHGIAHLHGGDLVLNQNSKNTQFVVTLRLRHSE